MATILLEGAKTIEIALHTRIAPMIGYQPPIPWSFLDLKIKCVGYGLIGDFATDSRRRPLCRPFGLVQTCNIEKRNPFDFLR